MKIGTLDITDCKIGGVQISEVRIGADLVWSSAPAYDADAQAFITAAGISDVTQQGAINQLVLDLKAASIWTKMKALYPFVGGSATTHKFNLKNPLDTDTAFRLTFSGGVTHDANGVTGNGVNGVGKSHLFPLTTLTTTSGAFGCYTRTNSDGAFIDIGGVGNNGGRQFIFTRLTNLLYATYGDGYPSTIPVANTDSRGFFVTNRNSATNTNTFKNGVEVNNSTQTITLSNDGSIDVMARSSGPGNIQFSPRNIAFAFVSDGLTNTNVSDFYTAVQTFQTTLSRNV